jgi:transcription antitermination protein NusB
MGLRRKSRELALQFLYGQDMQKDFCGQDVLEAKLNEFCTCFQADSKSLPYARQIISGLCAHWQEIDKALARCSHNWRIERMAAVDRNILRIAAYEMLHEEDVPPTVAINEALEIAKRYAEPEAISFINGILDGLKERS